MYFITRTHTHSYPLYSTYACTYMHICIYYFHVIITVIMYTYATYAKKSYKQVIIHIYISRVYENFMPCLTLMALNVCIEFLRPYICVHTYMYMFVAYIQMPAYVHTHRARHVQPCIVTCGTKCNVAGARYVYTSM